MSLFLQYFFFTPVTVSHGSFKNIFKHFCPLTVANSFVFGLNTDCSDSLIVNVIF